MASKLMKSVEKDISELKKSLSHLNTEIPLINCMSGRRMALSHRFSAMHAI